LGMFTEALFTIAKLSEKLRAPVAVDLISSGTFNRQWIISDKINELSNHERTCRKLKYILLCILRF
jgi:hypothetical protein